MDKFTFTRQTAIFLGVLAVLEALIVLLVPVVAIVAALIAFVLIVLVWLKAGVRTRKWLWWNSGSVPLTQAEGVIAVSAALLFGAGLLVAGYEGIRYASGERVLLASPLLKLMKRDHHAEAPTPVLPDPRTVVTRSTHYADPGMQRAFKHELAHAGIAYGAEIKQGKEFISWRPEDNPAVEKIQRSLARPPSPDDRSVHFDSHATQQAFKEWLVKRGVEYHVTNLHGREFVVWKEGPKELALMFIKEQHDRCLEPPKGKAAPTGC